MPDPLRQQLDIGLEQLGLVLPQPVREQLLAYRELLGQWNRAYNLTAVRDPAEQVQKHLLDSLAVLPWLQGMRVLDVGTGAGLPGIPLALACPDRQFTLLDSLGKRLRFLFQVKKTLGLDNVTLIESRIEAYRPEVGFDTVISRAFASLADFARLSGHCLAESGCLLAMKADCPAAELSALPKPFIVGAIHPLPALPGVGLRQLVEIRRPC